MLRAMVFQGVQLGLESTPGTIVPANRRLLGTMVTPRPEIPTDEQRSVGAKGAVGVSIQDEMSVADFNSNGNLAYNDVAYLLHLALSRTAYVFKPNPFGPETNGSASFDIGSSAGAERFGYATVDSFAFRFSQAEVSFRGTLFGQKLAEQITMTAAPTDVALEYAQPKGNAVFVADTLAGLTRVPKYLEANFSVGNARSPFFDMDDTTDTFREPVEGGWAIGASVALEHNAHSAALTTALRDGATKYFRFRNTGREYSAGNPFFIDIDFAAKLRNPGRGAQGNVFGATYDLLPIYDSTLASYFRITIGTNMASIS